MLVVHSPLSTLHAPKYEVLSGALVPYFESPTRVQLILDCLLADPESRFTALSQEWTLQELEEDSFRKLISEVHGEDYLDFLRTVYSRWVGEGGNPDAVLPETFLRQDLLLEPEEASARERQAGAIELAGRFSFDLSAPVTAETYLCALASARLAVRSVELLLEDRSAKGAFALCRPPGHHAAPSLCGGYCYLSNVAIATKWYQQQASSSSESTAEGKPKVAILDIDYHHGNGTSKVFYSDPSVFYVSLHGSPDYPYFTGASTEVGAGAGVGTNLNLPLPLGTNDEEYLFALSQAMNRIKSWSPEFLFVSLGVDTFIGDPLTDFKITVDAYEKMGRLIASGGVQTVFAMEGGYCLDKIGECVRGVLAGFEAGPSS
ncbi:Arginase/deacetylase [Leucosporidium creatinivorum]|uniref:Arginase/deacetylase n=1 Tax=Leucosporidium creatinivorum TaxID=106004 RepID=A0A1Y2EXG3_9BASI|nr:Arginase/deacetylase [Leucosporidium creatinivorum]